MRKLLAILLLAVFGVPLVSPLLASAADESASLPACCRRDGKHHCMTNMSQRSSASDSSAQNSGFQNSGAQISSIPGKCPYCPGTVVVTHRDIYKAGAADAIFAELVSHPAVAAQTESRWRMARDRSRQKRGPPCFFG